MSKQLGDFRRGATLDFKFVTTDATGAPTTLSGTPAISVYKGNNTTQTTTGVTLSADFDSVTGLNNVRVVTTDSFYEPLNDYQVVITTGTVDSVSVVGYVVAEFSIENRFAGEAVQLTAQAGAASTITLASAESSTDDFYNGDGILLVDGTGEEQFRQITDYVGSTRVATVDRAWATQPDSTTIYRRFPGSLGNTVAEVADAVLDEALSGHTTAGTLGKAVTDTPADAAAALLASTIDGVTVADYLSAAGGANFSISGTTLTVKDVAGNTIYTRDLTLVDRNAINVAAVP